LTGTPIGRHSAFAATRRRRLQLLRVLHTKSLKRRAGLPVRSLFAAACSSSLSISATLVYDHTRKI
jgi:hypothetical protein